MNKPVSLHLWLRAFLAGPLCFITAIAVMCGMALWLPPGPAKINNIAIPIVLFPAIWAVLFFYSVLDRQLGRAWLVTAALLLVHGGWVAHHVMVTQAAKPRTAITAPQP